MKEKLSVKKVYRNAFRYLCSHSFAFLFLTIFYFLGSLLPLVIGATSFKVVSLIYTYLFFYFAAGCYYKQQILWDKDIFVAAGIRFLGAIALFFAAIILSSVVINVGIQFLRMSFAGANEILDGLFNSAFWLVGKYIFIFMLFVVFFVVPSFAFVSEIAGKSRSYLITYAKTRGNLIQIGIVATIAFFILAIAMLILSQAHYMIAGFARSAVLVFVSVLYFKMYDFFYSFPQSAALKKTTKERVKPKEKKTLEDMVALEGEEKNVDER